jgi:hypothetical protein
VSGMSNRNTDIAVSMETKNKNKGSKEMRKYTMIRAMKKWKAGNRMVPYFNIKIFHQFM